MMLIMGYNIEVLFIMQLRMKIQHMIKLGTIDIKFMELRRKTYDVKQVS